MWSAFVNGSWQPVGTDESLVQWAQSGWLQRESPVHHSSMAESGFAGQVPFLAQVFGPEPMVHALARSARNWGFGALFCGAAAPVALVMGLRANAEIRHAPGRYSNGSDAVLAIVIGAGALVLMIMGIVGGVVGAMQSTPHPAHGGAPASTVAR